NRKRCKEKVIKKIAKYRRRNEKPYERTNIKKRKIPRIFVRNERFRIESWTEKQSKRKVSSKRFISKQTPRNYQQSSIQLPSPIRSALPHPPPPPPPPPPSLSTSSAPISKVSSLSCNLVALPSVEMSTLKSKSRNSSGNKSSSDLSGDRLSVSIDIANAAITDDNTGDGDKETDNTGHEGVNEATGLSNSDTAIRGRFVKPISHRVVGKVGKIVELSTNRRGQSTTRAAKKRSVITPAAVTTLPVSLTRHPLVNKLPVSPEKILEVTTTSSSGYVPISYPFTRSRHYGSSEPSPTFTTELLHSQSTKINWSRGVSSENPSSNLRTSNENASLSSTTNIQSRGRISGENNNLTNKATAATTTATVTTTSTTTTTTNSTMVDVSMDEKLPTKSPMNCSTNEDVVLDESTKERLVALAEESHRLSLLFLEVNGETRGDEVDGINKNNGNDDVDDESNDGSTTFFSRMKQQHQSDLSTELHVCTIPSGFLKPEVRESLVDLSIGGLCLRKWTSPMPYYFFHCNIQEDRIVQKLFEEPRHAATIVEEKLPGTRHWIIPGRCKEIFNARCARLFSSLTKSSSEECSVCRGPSETVARKETIKNDVDINRSSTNDERESLRERNDHEGKDEQQSKKVRNATTTKNKRTIASAKDSSSKSTKNRRPKNASPDDNSKKLGESKQLEARNREIESKKKRSGNTLTSDNEDTENDTSSLSSSAVIKTTSAKASAIERISSPSRPLETIESNGDESASAITDNMVTTCVASTSATATIKTTAHGADGVAALERGISKIECGTGTGSSSSSSCAPASVAVTSPNEPEQQQQRSPQQQQQQEQQEQQQQQEEQEEQQQQQLQSQLRKQQHQQRSPVNDIPPAESIAKNSSLKKRSVKRKAETLGNVEVAENSSSSVSRVKSKKLKTLSGKPVAMDSAVSKSSRTPGKINNGDRAANNVNDSSTTSVDGGNNASKKQRRDNRLENSTTQPKVKKVRRTNSSNHSTAVLTTNESKRVDSVERDVERETNMRVVEKTFVVPG
ncbi:hypothetical protein KPH14_013057, partial [Odynerus spinipes]